MKRKLRSHKLSQKKTKESSLLIEYITLLAAVFCLVAIMTTCSRVRASKQTLEKTAPIVGGVINLTTGNTVNFRGDFNDSSVAKAERKLRVLANIRGKAKYPIYLVFNSPGGSIDAGMELVSYINSIGNIHTITIDGASMAAMTVQLVKGNRYVTEDSTMMFHRAKINGIGGQIEVGEVETRVAYLKSMLRSIGTRVAKRLKISYADYSTKVKDEWWLYGTSIVEKNAADQVIEIKCSKKLEESIETSVVQTIFFAMELNYSGCPLKRSVLD